MGERFEKALLCRVSELFAAQRQSGKLILELNVAENGPKDFWWKIHDCRHRIAVA